MEIMSNHATEHHRKNPLRILLLQILFMKSLHCPTVSVLRLSNLMKEKKIFSFTVLKTGSFQKKKESASFQGNYITEPLPLTGEIFR